MKKATFYHAGFPICINAEQELLNLVDTTKVDVEVIHLGEQRNKIGDTETCCTSTMVRP